jgi:hypothetical protein
LTAVPAILWLAGAVAIIELAHHALVKASTEGPQMIIMGVEFSSKALLPWLVALGLFGIGAFLCRKTWPRVKDAWSEVHLLMKRSS